MILLAKVKKLFIRSRKDEIMCIPRRIKGKLSKVAVVVVVVEEEES